MKKAEIIKHMREIIPFVELVLRYEHCNSTYPYENDYFRFDRKDIKDERRFEKIIFYYEWLIDALKNAERRFENDVDKERYDKLRQDIIDGVGLDGEDF